MAASTAPKKTTGRKATAKTTASTAAPAEQPAETSAPVEADPTVTLDLDTLAKEAYVEDAVLEPFTFKHCDHKYTLIDIRDLDWRELLRVNPMVLLQAAMSEEDQAKWNQEKCPGWKLDALFTNWSEHFKVKGLGDLASLVGRSV